MVLEERAEKRTDCCPGQSKELADQKPASVVCPSSFSFAPALCLRVQPATKTTPLVFLLEGTSPWLKCQIWHGIPLSRCMVRTYAKSPIYNPIH